MATYDACGKEMPKKWRKRKEPPFWVVLVHTLAATEERGGEGEKKMYGGAFRSGGRKNEACLLADKTREL